MGGVGMVSSKRRSLAKTFTYFISDSLLTGCIALVVTREVSTSMSIALGVQVSELALYYFHERIWERVRKTPRTPKDPHPIAE